MNQQAPDDLGIEGLLRGQAPDPLPLRLASGRLWREIEARRRPRSVTLLSGRAFDAAAALGAALVPALAGPRR